MKTLQLFGLVGLLAFGSMSFASDMFYLEIKKTMGSPARTIVHGQNLTPEQKNVVATYSPLKAKVDKLAMALDLNKEYVEHYDLEINAIENRIGAVLTILAKDHARGDALRHYGHNIFKQLEIEEVGLNVNKRFIH